MRDTTDQLPGLLREWAEWFSKAQNAGWPEATTLWLAQLGSGGGGFKSAVPFGLYQLETRGALRRMIHAMDSLRADDDEKIWGPVLTVQCWYLCGADEVKRVTAKSIASLYNTVKIGETLIRREMKLR